MRIPDSAKQCVVFIGNNPEPGNLDTGTFGGTGFLVGVTHEPHGDEFTYLVTADHVLLGAYRQATLGDGEPIVRINDEIGESYELTLEGSRWYRHPFDDSVDLAITTFFPPKRGVNYIHENMLIKTGSFERFGIGEGSDVFTVSLFSRAHGKLRNVPIVRHGNLAMVPDDRIETRSPYGAMVAYLIEARSIGGISGAPVFVRETLATHVTMRGEPLTSYSLCRQFLLGVIHGHWDLPTTLSNGAASPRYEGVNMGIAIVTPAEKLIELLMSDELRESRDQIGDSHRERLRASVLGESNKQPDVS